MLQFSRFVALIIFILLQLPSCRKPEKGLSWTAIDSQTPYRITSITKGHPSILYACSGQRYSIGEVIRSQDGGQTWTSLDSVSSKILNDIEYFQDSTGLTVGYNGKMHRTFDRGTSWQFRQFHLWLPLYDIEFVNDTLGYIAGARGQKKGTIMKTNTAGETWTNERFEVGLRCIAFTSTRTGYAAGYGKILKTTDKGQSWQPTPAKGDYYQDICFPTKRIGYAVGYNGSVIKTTDAGASWQVVKKGNLPFQKRDNLEAVAFVNPNTGYAVGRNGLILKTENGGKNWIRYASPDDTDFKTIHLFNEHRGLVGGNNGWLQKFEEDGI
ncbi:MAG: hypothetical protein BRD50_03600 [Bacteroidetes bacterium SW_11_45_7]|nr:MAG: hypothetical protein BRD50_03600 [Bacteroidetes bacterium SW_11_45_7]